MKKTAGVAVIVLLGLFIWLSSFWITRSRAIEQWHADNPVWMQNVPENVAQQEQTFRQWIQAAAAELNTEQVKLSQLLSNPATPDEAILRQADTIAQQHADLMHNTAAHLDELRSELSTDQKQLLTGFCLQTLRGPMQRRYRHGQQDTASAGARQPGRNRFGNGLGNGFGQRHRRGRCGLTQKLQLTDEQIAVAEQKDPGFEGDIRQLQNRLLDERRALCSLLENRANSDDRITAQVDAVIDAHNALEKRLIRYILIMREHFTPQQQERLIGLCRRNCSNTECPRQQND